MSVIPMSRTMKNCIVAFKRVRVARFNLSETALVDLMAEALKGAEIAYAREVKLGPRCRVDLAVEDGDLLVGIEAKKGRPDAASTEAQVARYAATGKLSGVVMIAERAFDMPSEMSGIPCIALSLHSLFGIAL